MKTFRILILTICVSLFLFSCEKEIDLDLDESAQLFVIEGIVHDSLGDNFVLLSKTRPYDNNNAIEKVTNAIVQIKDGTGSVYTLTQTSPGHYTNASLNGTSGRTYELIVNIDGEKITATSYMNPRVEIDSLSYSEDPAFGDDEPSYSILCHFTDPLNVVNFYRMKSFLEDDQIDGYVNWNDDAIDGVSTGLPVFNASYEAGEVAIIQLLAVDETNFRYFTALELSQEGDVPGNPTTNLSGDKAVGYFGAYAKSQASLLIEP
jgi:hypothetical protein